MERLLSAGGGSIGVILCPSVLGPGNARRARRTPGMEWRKGADGRSLGVILCSGVAALGARPRTTPNAGYGAGRDSRAATFCGLADRSRLTGRVPLRAPAMERLLSAGGCSIGVILCSGVVGPRERP
jgi:hypothetical protein